MAEVRAQMLILTPEDRICGKADGCVEALVEFRLAKSQKYSRFLISRWWDFGGVRLLLSSFFSMLPVVSYMVVSR